MNAGTRLLILATLATLAGALLQGCGVVHGAFQVVTAPVRMIQRSADRPPQPGTRTTTTTTVTRTTRTTASDVTVPGHPVATPTPAPKRMTKAAGMRKGAPSPTPAPKVARKETERPKTKGTTKTKGATKTAKSTPPASPETAYPTAKRVPDKPGYVFSPFDTKGRYVDVSGYAPGSKVKDPWTNKIFVVP